MGAVESVRRYTPDETGRCWNCGHRREGHGEGGLCPISQKTLRRFVERAGRLVEVEQVVRETR